MFRLKPRQPSSDDLEVFLPEAKRAQLETGWPGVFRREILPMLWEAEADFADLYHPLFGAPNKPVAALLGILILKEFHDYTDEQTLEAVQFNMQWQYALQLGLSEAFLCQKTLHNFRERLWKSQRHQGLFHQLTGRIIDRFGLDTSRQRMDSTHVMGAMKQLTRLGLFVKTIEAFLFKLKRMSRRDEKVGAVLEQLPRKFHERYLEREGYFGDTRSSLASRRLDAVGRDLWELLDRFRGDKKVSHLKQYRHMQRLFKDQCELVPPPEPALPVPIPVYPEAVLAYAGTGKSSPPAEDPAAGPPAPPAHPDPSGPSKPAPQAEDTPPGPSADPAAWDPSQSDRSVCPGEASLESGQAVEETRDVQVALKPPQEISATSLQSPSDPDATFGHKGKGYQFQLAETCAPTNPFQVITTTLLQGAHESDQNATIPLLETLDEQGRKPEIAFADSNYISGENIVQAKAMGVNLQGPLPGSPPQPGKLSLADFTFDPSHQQVLTCPSAQAPLHQQPTRNQTGQNAYFDRTGCDVCPLADRCPTHSNRTQRRLTWTPAQIAIASRRAEEETAVFKDAYKIRSGIEATISHDKNDQGLGHLRVRGRPAVELAATFKTLAINVRRAVKYALKTMKEAVQTHPQAPKELLAPLFRSKSGLWGLLKGFLERLWGSEAIWLNWITSKAS